MSAMVSQITSLAIVYSIVYSGADQRKHQSSASLAFVRGIHRWPVNSLHKGPVTWKKFPFDDVIMKTEFHIKKKMICEIGARTVKNSDEITSWPEYISHLFILLSSTASVFSQNILWRGSLMFSLICALSKESHSWWFETPSCSLCND